MPLIQWLLFRIHPICLFHWRSKWISVISFISYFIPSPKKPDPRHRVLLYCRSLDITPVFRFVLGAKINLGKQNGDPKTTDYSIISLNAFLSTSGIVTGQVRHNVFTEGNKWNYQGNWQISRFGLVDYGLGVDNIEGSGGDFDGRRLACHQSRQCIPDTV